MKKTATTSCSRDCPDACTLEVVLEGDRAVQLKGGKNDPVTRGFLCERTTRFLERQYSPERFTQPLLRQAGELTPISWEQALDLAAEKLSGAKNEFGGESILHYRSGGAMGILKCLSDYLFENFGPVTLKSGDICSGAGEAAQEADFGICDSSDVFDLYNSKLIVIWGKNVHTSNTHLVPILMEAKRRGAILVGLDPVRSRIASQCELFLQPKPGEDYAVAMGLTRYLFEQGGAQGTHYCNNVEAFRSLAFEKSLSEWAEQAGLEESDLLALARLYHQHRPSTILIGWGLGRRRNGAATTRALDGLAAVSGNLGVPGGGCSFYFARRSAFDTSFVEGRAARKFPEARLGPEMLAAEPKIRVAWVTAGNPVAMLPQAKTVQKAFQEVDFTVVVETHPTDTTDCADLILPTLSLLEDDDILGAYGNHYLRLSKPVLRPPGEARHELWIWQQLAQRLGLGELLAGTPEDWKARVLRPEVTLDDFSRGPVLNPYSQKVLFEGHQFPTPSGKVELMSQKPVAGPRTDSEYPYTLLAVATPKAQSSQWSVEPPRIPTVEVYDCGRFRPGQECELQSKLGKFRVLVQPQPSLRPGVVLMPKGGMHRFGWCANSLIEAEETDHGGGACYYDEPVRLVEV